MKKIIIICLLLFICILIISCNGRDNNPEATTEQTTGGEDPFLVWVNQGHDPGAYTYCKEHPDGNPDPEYPSWHKHTGEIINIDDFIFETEFSQYTSDTETINCYIEKINNVSTFYYLAVPYVEFYENGEWDRILHVPITLFVAPWPLLGSGPYGKATLTIDTSELFPAFAAGRYRAVAFVGDECTPLYAEFEIID